MSRPVIGIVVPTMGERADWLRDCVASVASQLAPTDRIVMVGPHSETLRTIADQFELTALFRPARGLAAAINEGFEELAGCDYLTWLGDDDILAPGAIDVALSALEANPAANFVYGNTRYIDARGQSIYSAPATSLAPYYMRVGKDFVPQPGSLLRASALLAHQPPIDPMLRNAMDLDMFLRLSTAGRSSWCYVNREVSAYRVHGGAITANKEGVDESAAVRARYLSSRSAPWLRLFRRPRLFVEKAVVWIQWRACKPTVPRVNGVPYTQPGAYMSILR
ncbi:glycosyltransferase [Microbacterium testaceum]|uniref:glycosyltransferase n=1 Tax=Microbacterium testaceum TaxID=2033 RepID=UPI0027D7B2A3|nr:glycosyltransferase [Microbacterium testaceum]